MKKLLSTMILSLGALATPIFANNCITNLPQTPAESDLYLPYCDIKDSDVPAIIEYLKANSNIDAIFLQGNQITSKSIIDLVQLPNITYLFIAENPGITDEAVEAIVNSHVDQLHIGVTGISDDGVKRLLKSKRLIALDLEYADNITDKAFEEAQYNQTLQDLDLYDTKITGKAMENIAKMRLTELHAHKAPIGDEGARHLATNKTIEHLDLDHSGITDKGIKEIAKMGALSILEVSDNLITNEGADALSKMTTLVELRADHNFISNKGAVSLAASPSIRELYLSSNYIANEGAIAFAKTKRITILDLAGNYIGKIGVWALEKNPVIKELDVYGNYGKKDVKVKRHQHH